MDKLLKDLTEAKFEKEKAISEKDEAMERSSIIEENLNSEIKLLNDHCEMLQIEIKKLNKKKVFQEVRIRTLTEEVEILQRRVSVFHHVRFIFYIVVFT